MQLKFELRRSAIPHTTTKGDANEDSWIEVLRGYLPTRYQMERAFVVDSNGSLSEQQDIVIFDRHFSPFVYQDGPVLYVPAESVYAVFEAKSSPLDAAMIKAAAKKAASVRRLHRTVLDTSAKNIEINYGTTNGRKIDPKPIYAGILTRTSGWNPPFGDSFKTALMELSYEEQLNFGCALETGSFCLDYRSKEVFQNNTKEDRELWISEASTGMSVMILKLLSTLQRIGTVAPMDIEAYLKEAGRLI